MQDNGSLNSDRIGELLREARISRGLATEEVAWKLRVRPEVIRTLETRDPVALGQPSVVRSQLASYARLLGLDEVEILGAFDSDASAQDRPVEALEEQARSVRLPPRARWILAAAISLGALAVASFAGVLGTESETVAETSAPPAAIDDPSVTTVRMEVSSREPTQMSVTTDGVQVFEGTLEPGDTKTFRARTEIRVVAADAGVIRIEVNGRPIETGEPGDAFSAVFGPGGRRR